MYTQDVGLKRIDICWEIVEQRWSTPYSMNDRQIRFPRSRTKFENVFLIAACSKERPNKTGNSLHELRTLDDSRYDNSARSNAVSAWQPSDFTPPFV